MVNQSHSVQCPSCNGKYQMCRSAILDKCAICCATPGETWCEVILQNVYQIISLSLPQSTTVQIWGQLSKKERIKHIFEEENSISRNVLSKKNNTLSIKRITNSCDRFGRITKQFSCQQNNVVIWVDLKIRCEKAILANCLLDVFSTLRAHRGSF